jgi:hypothetical protein
LVPLLVPAEGGEEEEEEEEEEEGSVSPVRCPTRTQPSHNRLSQRCCITNQHSTLHPISQM